MFALLTTGCSVEFVQNVIEMGVLGVIRNLPRLPPQATIPLLCVLENIVSLHHHGFTTYVLSMLTWVYVIFTGNKKQIRLQALRVVLAILHPENIQPQEGAMNDGQAPVDPVSTLMKSKELRNYLMSALTNESLDVKHMVLQCLVHILARAAPKRIRLFVSKNVIEALVGVFNAVKGSLQSPLPPLILTCLRSILHSDPDNAALHAERMRSCEVLVLLRDVKENFPELAFQADEMLNLLQV
eukprot:TRINITY_DN16728_c0_g1_i1.p1 TRINITY_DN16728_c0_g1~~TRINITY_DN16728_c0_g1_i1.p1  ORF type:complete len:241 (+),score=21.17 TRINITY_DN16728_c0_g1_i1:106-828(+)